MSAISPMQAAQVVQPAAAPVAPTVITAAKPAAEATSGAWGEFTSPFVRVAQWGGRQVQWLLNAAYDSCAAIVSFVKPLFTFIGRTLVDYYDRVREICVENKALLVPVTLALLAGGIIVLGVYFILSSEESSTPTRTPQTTA